MQSLRFSVFFGVLRVPSRLPNKKIALFAAQGDPASILVFDALTCLELPYVWKSCAHQSSKMAELKKVSGGSRIPFLHDLNTDWKSSDSFSVSAFCDLYLTVEFFTLLDCSIFV